MDGKKSNLIKGNQHEWEVVIGLEIHAQLASRSKLFSSAPTGFGAAPNSQVTFVDAAMPGMLPVLNQECVYQAIRTGLALNAQVNHYSLFARKNYFYADLPQGYQISQFDKPIVSNGKIWIDLPEGSQEIRIERLHLEQDAGKSLHDQEPGKSFIDLNRSGIALMEIVSHPDMRCANQAALYVEKIRSILRYVGSCDGNMQEGSLRADANVSVRLLGDNLGTRCEIKNLNSLKFLRQAIDFEARRQIMILEQGGVIAQETRLFNVQKGETLSMRSKEEAHDYRYFSDPDLPPLVITDAQIAKMKAQLPELPDTKSARFMADYKIGAYEANILVVEQSRSDYFEQVAQGVSAKLASSWVISELLGRLNKAELVISESPVSAAQLNELLKFIESGAISGRIAKEVFDEMMATGKHAGVIIAAKGLQQISDTGAIEAMIEKIITENPKQVQSYQGGNQNLLGWFVGQVMKQSGGKANPAEVNRILKEKL